MRAALDGNPAPIRMCRSGPSVTSRAVDERWRRESALSTLPSTPDDVAIGLPQSSRTRRGTFARAVQRLRIRCSSRDRVSSSIRPAFGLRLLHLLPQVGDAGFHSRPSPRHPSQPIFDCSRIRVAVPNETMPGQRRTAAALDRAPMPANDRATNGRPHGRWPGR